MPDIFDVVADPTRRELLSALLAKRSDGLGETGEQPGEMSVTQLVTAMGLSQPTVSKHLKVLRDSHLVAVREQGQRRFYRLDHEPLMAVEEWLHPFVPAAVVPMLESEGPYAARPSFQEAVQLGVAARGLAERIGSASGRAAHVFRRMTRRHGLLG
jgi:DNA-binding transcriptional ArsR family regulator